MTNSAEGPRLSQLFIWMTCCAVYFAAARHFLPNAPQSLEQHLLLVAISLYTGLCWTGVIEVIRRTVGSGRQPIEPGTWFLFSIGLVLAAELSVDWLPSRFGLRPEPIHVGVRCLALALPTLSRRLPGHWKFVFFVLSLLSAVKLIGLIGILSNDAAASPALVQWFGLARSGTGLLLMAWAIVRDRKHPLGVGWLHWMGILAGIIWVASEMV